MNRFHGISDVKCMHQSCKISWFLCTVSEESQLPHADHDLKPNEDTATVGRGNHYGEASSDCNRDECVLMHPRQGFSFSKCMPFLRMLMYHSNRRRQNLSPVCKVVWARDALVDSASHNTASIDFASRNHSLCDSGRYDTCASSIRIR